MWKLFSVGILHFGLSASFSLFSYDHLGVVLRTSHDFSPDVACSLLGI